MCIFDVSIGLMRCNGVYWDSALLVTYSGVSDRTGAGLTVNNPGQVICQCTSVIKQFKLVLA